DFKLKVAWDGTEQFTGTGADVSDRLVDRDEIEFSRGKDQQRIFAPPMAGLMSAEIDNRSKDYSPGNTGSPLYGKVVPGRKVQLSTTSPTRVVWSGFLSSIVQK